ncbi:MAG: ABC transporter permease [Candidatus Hodarchaeales archaeon]|jgi:ABC-2 type transport system permease protein
MSTAKQILSLVKQELQSARRTRYVIFTFVLMPIFMWGLQGGLQAFMGLTLTQTQAGETIYVVNLDTGNGSYNLGEVFIDRLVDVSTQNNTIIEGSIINSTAYADLTYTELMDKLADPQYAAAYTPLIIIPESFTANYNLVNFSQIEMYTMPGGLIGSSMLEAAMYSIVSQPPFTMVTVHKYVTLDPTTVVFEGEEGAASGFGIGFVGMISIMVAVMAPAPFVSTSFAGEREKKTMESLLALPISRFNILFAKLLAGMVLVGIFTLMNLVGLTLFSVLIGSLSSLGGNEGAEAYASVFSIDASIELIILTSTMMLLSAFVAIGIGISIASFTKDVRSAESMYNMILLVPSLGVGMIGMFGGVPEQAFGGAGVVLYIIPWAHALAILSKGLYPQTYASTALTGSIPLDLVFHFGYLIVLIFVFLFIASKVFERESILT